MKKKSRILPGVLACIVYVILITIIVFQFQSHTEIGKRLFSSSVGYLLVGILCFPVGYIWKHFTKKQDKDNKPN